MSNLQFVRRSAFAMLAALSIAACGDDSDPTDPGTDDLTAAEAEIMMEALVAAGGTSFFVPPVVTGAPAAQPVQQSQNFDETVPCPGGGNIQMSGTVTVNSSGGETGSLSMDVTQVHSNCAATADSNGSTWTFNGDPNVTVDFDWQLSETSVSMSGSQSGGISYSSGSRSGSCSINLSYDFDVSSSGQSVSGTVQGSICGLSVSEGF